MYISAVRKMQDIRTAIMEEGMERYCAWCDTSLDNRFILIFKSLLSRALLLFNKNFTNQKTHGICDKCFLANFPAIFSLSRAKEIYSFKIYPNMEIIIKRKVKKKYFINMEDHLEKQNLRGHSLVRPVDRWYGLQQKRHCHP
jgi:hypothetical protein